MTWWFWLIVLLLLAAIAYLLLQGGANSQQLMQLRALQRDLAQAEARGDPEAAAEAAEAILQLVEEEGLEGPAIDEIVEQAEALLD